MTNCSFLKILTGQVNKALNRLIVLSLTDYLGDKDPKKIKSLPS